jgi:hypothetical protein
MKGVYERVEVLVSRNTERNFLLHTAAHSPSFSPSGHNWLDEFIGGLHQQWMDRGSSTILPHNWKSEVRIKVDSSSNQKIVGHGMGPVGAAQWIFT